MSAIVKFAHIQSFFKVKKHSIKHVRGNGGYLIANVVLQRLDGLGIVGVDSTLQVTPEKKVRRGQVRTPRRPESFGDEAKAENFLQTA